MSTSNPGTGKSTGAFTPASAKKLRDSSVAGVLGSADSSVADALQNITLVHQARLSQQKRALNLAVTQYGATSAEARSAQLVATSTERTTARLHLTTQQATTTPPTVAANGWALHGRVLDGDLKPLADYAVFLVDHQKNYVSEYGFAYTDSTGYFLMNYAGTATGSSASKQAAGKADVFLEITNPKAEPVYLSTTAFQPVTGTATYQNITLQQGAPAIGNPPQEIRNVAMPPLSDKKKP
jgi:hypothetical protein